MSKYVTLTLAIGVALLMTARNVSANENEKTPTDWEEAYDYRELVDVDTFSDKTEWETYVDKEQEVMWSQPVGTTKEEFLGYMSSGSTGESLDICIIIWLWPYSLEIKPDGASGDTYYTYTYESTCYDPDADTCKQYYFTGNDCWLNLDGYVYSIARATTNHSSTYDTEYFDMDGPGGYQWRSTVDYETPWYTSPYYYYPMYENSDIEGEANWDYCSGYTKKIAQHWFEACDYDLVLRVGYRYDFE